VPLSQSVLIDIYPKERQGFCHGAVRPRGDGRSYPRSPCSADGSRNNYSWRYVFYINLPVGAPHLWAGLTVFSSA